MPFAESHWSAYIPERIWDKLASFNFALPFREHRGIKSPGVGYLPRTAPRDISFMSAATPVSCLHVDSSEPVSSETLFSKPQLFVEENIASASGSESDVNAEDSLQAQRWEAIGRLTGGVVHDFNNLLTGVMLYCDLLLSAFDERDLRRRYAEEIRSAIIPASALVRQLLVFARPQQESSYPVSFNEIAEEMRELLNRLVGENISLEFSLEPHLAPVKISRSQAQQILLNLVLNARDALPKGGRICIQTNNAAFQPIDCRNATVASPGFPCVLISIADNGTGMDPETQRHLFEAFFTTKAGKGNGLGLTTVQSIVKSHRGLIHFKSHPGLGTCAMILLPQALERARAEVSMSPVSAQSISAREFQDLTKDSLS